MYLYHQGLSAANFTHAVQVMNDEQDSFCGGRLGDRKIISGKSGTMVQVLKNNSWKIEIEGSGIQSFLGASEVAQ